MATYDAELLEAAHRLLVRKTGQRGLPPHHDPLVAKRLGDMQPAH